MSEWGGAYSQLYWIYTLGEGTALQLEPSVEHG